MNETSRDVLIDAPQAVVWSLLEDVRRMPQLSPSTEDVEAPARLERVGDRFTQTVRIGGRRFRSEWTVTDIVEERLLAIEGQVLPGTRYEMIEEIEPVGDQTRLRLTMRWKLPFGPLGRLAGKLGVERRAVDEAAAVLDGLKRTAESTVRALGRR